MLKDQICSAYYIVCSNFFSRRVIGCQQKENKVYVTIFWWRVLYQEKFNPTMNIFKIIKKGGGGKKF